MFIMCALKEYLHVNKLGGEDCRPTRLMIVTLVRMRAHANTRVPRCTRFVWTITKAIPIRLTSGNKIFHSHNFQSCVKLKKK